LVTAKDLTVDIGVITDVSTTLTNVNKILKKSFSTVEEIYSACEIEDTLYLDADFQPTDKSKAEIKMVPVGETGCHLLFRMKIREDMMSEWRGCLVGTPDYLQRKNIEIQSRKMTHSSYEEISKRLKSLCQQPHLIAYLERRVQFLLAIGQGYKQKGTTITFNTGLVTVYNTVLTVKASLNELNHLYKIEIELNMPETEVSVVLSTIYRNMILIPTEGSFLNTSQGKLEYLVDERSYRCTKAFDSLSLADKVSAVSKSIEHAEKMIKINPYYAAPSFYIAKKKLNFLIPLYASFSDLNEPTGAIMIDNTSGEWLAKTIINLQTAYLNSRVIAPIAAEWLERGTEICIP